jgi:hypothetical protein
VVSRATLSTHIFNAYRNHGEQVFCHGSTDDDGNVNGSAACDGDDADAGAGTGSTDVATMVDIKVIMIAMDNERFIYSSTKVTHPSL